MQQTPRRTRLKRDRKMMAKDWRVVPPDLAILTLLYRYRLLRGTTIYELLPINVNTIKKRLRILYDQNIIDKVNNTRGARPNLNQSDIYQLGKKGYQFLKDNPHRVTNLQYIEVEEPVRDFEHTMMICDTLSGIEIGVRELEHTFISQGEILAYRTEPSLAIPYNISHRFESGHVERRESRAIPDGIFGVKRTDGTSRLLLMEAEHFSPLTRTTLKTSSTLRKVLAYRSIKQAKATKAVFGKSAFNLLLVFPTEARMYNARDMVLEKFGEEPLILFGHQPVQEQQLHTIKPNPELYTGEWLRAGLPPIKLSEI